MAPQSLAACSATASSTGWTSVGELLMTRRISLGRCLPFQRFRQLGVSRLQLPEEPDVLDRDDGLVGEGLKQLDLGVGEQAGLGAAHRDHADHDGRRAAWDGKQGPNPAEPKGSARSFAEARVARGRPRNATISLVSTHAADGKFRIRSLREMRVRSPQLLQATHRTAPRCEGARRRRRNAAAFRPLHR